MWFSHVAKLPPDPRRSLEVCYPIPEICLALDPKMNVIPCDRTGPARITCSDQAHARIAPGRWGDALDDNARRWNTHLLVGKPIDGSGDTRRSARRLNARMGLSGRFGCARGNACCDHAGSNDDGRNHQPATKPTHLWILPVRGLIGKVVGPWDKLFSSRTCTLRTAAGSLASGEIPLGRFLSSATCQRVCSFSGSHERPPEMPSAPSPTALPRSRAWSRHGWNRFPQVSRQA
jgi:hypothetical protein